MSERGWYQAERARYLAELWRRMCGRRAEADAQAPDYPRLAASEWSAEFEGAMRARLIMGALRYGPLGAPGKPAFDRIGAIRLRLDAYARDGNLEHLVDVANLALVEFVESRHPQRHFAATDDGIHVTVGGASDGQ